MATSTVVGVEVPKEYVRQQLQSMGICDISEEDLEAYTRDFSRLLHHHLQHDQSADASLEPSLADTPPVIPSLHTPNQPPPTTQPQSAVFKTFPGDSQSRVHHLPPSATPSPLQVNPSTTVPSQPHNTPRVTGGGPSPAVSSPGSARRSVMSSGGSGSVSDTRRPVRRKVLRRRNGEAQVFDESISDFEAPDESPAVAAVSSRLSDLSITSLSTADTSTDTPHGTSDLHHPQRPTTAPTRQQQCKSFIRPPTSHPHTRGIKKCDPVTRYHKFRHLWETCSVPGEKTRSSLRWHIREQLMHYGMPRQQPQRRRVYHPNDFVVPTEKKRLPLRWEIRHQLAQQ